MVSNVRRGLDDRGPGRPSVPRALGALAGVGALALLGVTMTYNACKLEVPTGYQAVMVRKAGLELEPGMELAAAPKNGAYYKGVQPGVLTEGRYFYNPFYWEWEIKEQLVVPDGKVGVRIALDGTVLPAGQVLADPGQKGIQRQVLMPGRYPYNWYAEKIETHEMVTVPAGYQGVVTLLAGRTPKDPNVSLVGEGERGVQKKTIGPGTWPINPYETRVSLVDCRSKRFNLGQDAEMDFLSADGFPVTLDGAIEFRVIPERAAEVFVLYNEDHNGDNIDEEIISKIITPESRSICRIGGSKLTGGQFISGNDRELFQQNLDKTLRANCRKQGVEILAVAITSIQPPEAIAQPVQQREVAKQQLEQYQQEKLQKNAEALAKVQELLADQKQAMVEAEQSVVEQTTKAEQEQAVAKTLAEQKLAVAKTGLEAVKAKADAVVAAATASADVIRFKNKAELSGLAARVAAFDGDGSAVAQNILLTKLAPAFRSIMSNSEGPLMDLFGQFTKAGAAKARKVPASPGDQAQAPSREAKPAEDRVSHVDEEGKP
jgi:regulator of protease activity HflC (stomatin/prohibitin superfamily)